MKRAEQAAAIAARLHHALHLAEAGQDQSINRLGKLAQALTRSRKEAGLSATVGQPAFNALARAMAAQIEAQEAMVELHHALADANAAARIDHRTLEAQGIRRTAEPHLGLARHIENAYGHMKSRVANWLAVVKRNELYRAFAPYERRDAAAFTRDVASIRAFTDGLMDHWRKRPRRPQPPPPSKEVSHEW